MSKDPTVSINNFINKYGKPNLIKLIDMFKRNVSGNTIAREFGVTRQQVFYWKNIFGESRVMYFINPTLQNVLGIEEITPKIRSIV